MRTKCRAATLPEFLVSAGDNSLAGLRVDARLGTLPWILTGGRGTALRVHVVKRFPILYS